ncbi:MAG TPA: sulfide/dihydroorotate dehydrogenase-like FAD/NAD-binding protein [Phycisphaerae bacterium]|nr:sulfide/dihydroorotate dehydrogenase-like FAD/NAD-binding protein [Phycisphaerae bacterium]
MFPILDARQLASDVKWFRIKAPLVAKHRQPGQFVILRLGENGERIPLTIADTDVQAGTIELIVKAIGKTTTELCKLGKGDSINDVMGPLGRPTEIEKVDHAVLVGGGVGTAVIYPLAKALRTMGNYVTSITGGRTRELVVLEEELKKVSDVVYATTDDGSYGFKGTVADKLRELMAVNKPPIGAIYCAGPVPMMRAIVELTHPTGIKTIVSLNPIMVDGTGMCGGCRVSIGGETKFACVDGPEFDGHKVDFKELADRLTAYRKQEKVSFDRFQGHECKLGTQAPVSGGR